MGHEDCQSENQVSDLWDHAESSIAQVLVVAAAHRKTPCCRALVIQFVRAFSRLTPTVESLGSRRLCAGLAGIPKGFICGISQSSVAFTRLVTLQGWGDATRDGVEQSEDDGDQQNDGRGGHYEAKAAELRISSAMISRESTTGTTEHHEKNSTND